MANTGQEDDAMGRQTLKISAIRVDQRVLPREADPQVVRRYQEVIKRTGMPPIDVFHDGKTYRLADGLQRYEAHKGLERTEIVCNVQEGGRDAAIWYAAGANQKHGLPMKNRDRQQAAVNILRSVKLCKDLSDAKIADRCGYTAGRIAQLRRQLEESGEIKRRETRTYVDHRSGETVTARIPGPKKQPDAKAPAPKPPTKAQQKAMDKAAAKDELGDEMPAWLSNVAADRYHLNNVLNAISNVTETADTVAKLPSGVGQFLDLTTLASMAQEMRLLVKKAMFHCVCPDCRTRGKVAKSCVCKGRGWMTKSQYQEAYQA